MNYPASLTNLTGPALAVVAVGDPGRTRTVLASILFLVAIGVGLVALAAWLIRSTRVDPEVLAPLEVMSQRAWRRADPVWQRRRLDQVRPDGAEPLDPTVPPPSTDAEFDRGPQLGGFDDFDDLLRRFGVDLDAAAPAAAAPVDQALDVEAPVDERAVPSSPVDEPVDDVDENEPVDHVDDVDEVDETVEISVSPVDPVDSGADEPVESASVSGVGDTDGANDDVEAVDDDIDGATDDVEEVDDIDGATDDVDEVDDVARAGEHEPVDAGHDRS